MGDGLSASAIIELMHGASQVQHLNHHYSGYRKRIFRCGSNSCEEVEFELVNGDIYKPTDYGSKSYHWRAFTLKRGGNDIG